MEGSRRYRMDFYLALNVSAYIDSFKVVIQTYMIFSVEKISKNLDSKSAKASTHAKPF